MVRDDGLQPVEPEARNLGEHFALVGNARAQDIVERGDPVSRDDQEAIAELVDIANLPLTIRASVGERGLEYWSGERQQNPRGRYASYKAVRAPDNNNM